MGLIAGSLFAKSVNLKGTSGAAPAVADWPNATEQKLLAGDGAGSDMFGSSVAIAANGNTAVIGSPNADANVLSSGAAYIYKWNGAAWDETKLSASDGADSDKFGQSVAVSDDGNTVLVGAYWDDDNGSAAGSAYVYRWDGSSWGQTKLLASDGAASDHFGWSVTLSGDGNTAIVGAYLDDDKGDASGSVYIYRWNGTSWAESKLTANDGAASDWFGYSVSLSGDGNTALIGAYGDDDNGSESGSAYIGEWNGTNWVQTKLTASDGAASDRFGYSVSVSGDGSAAIVGAYQDDDAGLNSGAAYIYKWNGTGWDETKLTASDGAGSDFFGMSVAISEDGNTALVGAYADDDAGSTSGAAYIYKWNGTGWDETKLTANDAAAGDWFGYSVAISDDGSSAVVGASRDADNGSASGSAYVYRA